MPAAALPATALAEDKVATYQMEIKTSSSALETTAARKPRVLKIVIAKKS